MSNSNVSAIILPNEDINLHFAIISPAETIPLRHAVLWPHMDVSHVCLPEDNDGLHLGAFLPSEEAPVAVISLFCESLPIIDNEILSLPSGGDSDPDPCMVRFRKFACEVNHQGKGIGTKLLKFAISMAQSELKAKIVWCDARASAGSWYQQRGLTTFGDKFHKNEVEYIRMTIDLSRNYTSQ